MPTAVETLRAALGLAETAGVVEIQKTIDQILLADMTPEEKAKMMARLGKPAENGEDEPTDEEKKEKDEQMAEFRTVLALSETATSAEILAAVKKLAEPKEPTDTTLTLELKELQDRVKALEPKAALAEKLEKEAREKSRDLFFSEQIRQGKLAPVDKEFYVAMWAKDETAVRKFFDGRKANSVVKLAETGTDLGGVPDDERDPRDTMNELAEKRATEKGIGFVEALNQIKAEQPALSEAVAALYGPAGLRHARR